MNGIMYSHNSFSIFQSVYFVSKMKVFTNELLIAFRNPIVIQTGGWIYFSVGTQRFHSII